MNILGLETSCDETAAAVVEDGTKLLSNVLASSAQIQAKSGGIIPEIAAREQSKFIIPVISRSLAKASGIEIKKSETGQVVVDKKLLPWAKQNIDAIAVTAGPGLAGSLLVGVEAAKALSFAWSKPLVPVVHTLAHVYSNWLVTNRDEPKFPAIVLTVSGGHTDILLMKGHGTARIIGTTRDDTAGEAFDKIARHLGLGFPGGPLIEKAASKGNSKAVFLPRPMINASNFDFSFSGLKTAFLRVYEGKKFKIADLAASSQDAIVEVLVTKTLRAVKVYKVSSLLLAGGVAANSSLRSALEKKSSVPVYIPPVDLCTDNGAFVASYAFFNYKPLPLKQTLATPNIELALKRYGAPKDRLN